MNNRLGISRALKLPSHITLQKPFRYVEKEETFLLELLRHFSIKQHAFPVELSGFGSFPPRVLFVNVEKPQPVTDIFEKLKKELDKKIQLEEYEKMNNLHQHMTIAFRDLTKEAYIKAWQEFRDREFHA